MKTLTEKQTAKVVKQLEKIVSERFDYIPNLDWENETNDSDSFPEVSLCGLREVLLKAYELGRASR